MQLVLDIEDKDAERLANRLSRFVSGRLHGAEKKDTGNTWSIGATNDWWLSKIDNTWVLQYRYPKEDKMKALQVVLEWIVGVRSTIES
jgi:hypothetical protein